MNKSELASAVAEKANLTSKQAAEAVNAVLDTIANEVVNGNAVRLVGFGSFELKQAAARTGKNPRTGEEIAIPARKKMIFRAGKNYRDI